MLPTTTDVLRAAEVLGAQPPIVCRERLVQQALVEAEHLVNDSLDVPAALHFTFTRHRNVFSQHTGRVLAAVLESTCSSLGLKIMATPAELEQRLGAPPSSVEDARDWFASRVVMFGG